MNKLRWLSILIITLAIPLLFQTQTEANQLSQAPNVQLNPQPGPNFAQVWRDLGGNTSQLGSPARPVISGQDFAIQYFQSGMMYWINTTQTPGSIWVMDTQNADFSQGNFWNVYNDRWSGNQTYLCTEAANNGEVGPVRGFGTLWCNRPNVRTRLGDPTESEQGSAGTPPFGSLQRFQAGWMLYNPIDREVYVLYDDGNWERHPVTGVIPTPPPNPQRPDRGWHPDQPPAGQGSLAFLNHHYPDPVTIAINRQQYQVPPQTGAIPGHVQLDLPPGDYSYTASVPGEATTGRVEVRQGRIIGLHITVPEIDEDDEGYHPDDAVKVRHVDITDEAHQTPLPQPTVPAGSTQLILQSYVNQPATMTINNRQYQVIAQGQHTISLDPGIYNYTVSVPGKSASGQINLAAGQQLDMSISIDHSRNLLQLYRN